ncbi:MAG: phosphopantetheine-binding protein [Promethearchaeota archaeon]
MSQTEVFNTLISEIFSIPVDDLDDDSTPDDIENWTSVSHMDLMAKFEEKFELELDVEEITEMDSIGAMKESLRNHGIQV